MYDPIESEYYNEWIELFNPTNKSMNISGWTIIDNSAEDSLEADHEHGNGTTIIPPYGYAIIADHGTKIYENFSINNDSVRLYVDDKSIGNGLGNKGDKIVLKNSLNETIDGIEWIENFSDIPGQPALGIREGNSLCRYINVDTNNSSNDFYEALTPTPGSENIFTCEYDLEINCIEKEFLIRRNETLDIFINIENKGSCQDNVTINISSISNGWNAVVNKDKIILGIDDSDNVTLQVSPCQRYGCVSGYINVNITSDNNKNVSDELKLFFEIRSPDLTIRKIKVYDEYKNECNTFSQGEVSRIKAFLKNYGKQDGFNVMVYFYYDTVDPHHLIGSKYYDSVSKYQKYPSVLWDTHGLSPGKHKILVIVDQYDTVKELYEDNNQLTYNIQLLNTTPYKQEKKVIISEIYYHNYPGIENEYIKVSNPTDCEINLSGWYLTNNPRECKLDHDKISFPANTFLSPENHIIITSNASAFKYETDILPDFEYNRDSDKIIPQMNTSKRFFLSNEGEALALKDDYNHTIDLAIFGNISHNLSGWNDEPISPSGEGVILRRNIDELGFPIDTNCSLDWINSRIYRIGQSNFPLKKFFLEGEIKVFVSPDSSYNAIINELQKANHSIFLNIYEFTHPWLCDELIKALLRNVSVNILLEGAPVGGISSEEIYILDRISNYGGKIHFIISRAKDKIFARYPFNHGKYLIIDNQIVIVESCNWAITGVPVNPSFGNREWGIIINNSDLASYYLNVFKDDFSLERCDIITYNDMDLELPPGFLINDYVPSGIYKPIFDRKKFIGNFTAIPVISPDTSYQAVYDLINSAKNSIYIQQLYIYKDWEENSNPLVDLLIEKASNDIDVKIILNYNPTYEDTNIKSNITKKYLERYGIEVKFLFTNWSIFTNAHNKGVIIDNQSVLVSSINWNYNSFMRNREAGIIVENSKIANYYSDIFFLDWNLNPSFYNNSTYIEKIAFSMDYTNTFYIIVIYSLTFALIARDWRKRQWKS